MGVGEARAGSLAGWCVPTTTAGLCNGAAIAPPRLLRQQLKPWLNLLFLPTPILSRVPPLSHSLLGKVVPHHLPLVGKCLFAPRAWPVEAHQIIRAP